MSQVITTLNKKGDTTVEVYPNIVSDNIPSDAVTTAKIANSSVTTNKISDGAVTETKIYDASVTRNKLSYKCVNHDKIDDEAISLSKLDGSSLYLSRRQYILEGAPLDAVTDVDSFEFTIDYATIQDEVMYTSTLSLVNRLNELHYDGLNLLKGSGYVIKHSDNSIWIIYKVLVTPTYIRLHIFNSTNPMEIIDIPSSSFTSYPIAYSAAYRNI